MKLRGKDYCNCEHAQMLRAAIEHAVGYLPEGDSALNVLLDALEDDRNAEVDLWGEVDVDTQLVGETEWILAVYSAHGDTDTAEDSTTQGADWHSVEAIRPSPGSESGSDLDIIPNE